MRPEDQDARRPWPPAQRDPLRVQAPDQGLFTNSGPGNYRAGLPRQQAQPPQRPASWPDYAPDPPKKRRPKQRSPWPALVVIMLVLGVGFGAAGYVGLRWMQGQAATPINEGTDAAGTSISKVDSAAVGEKPRVLGLNRVGRDGGFAFKVTRVRTGARATYVYLVLKNVGAEPVPLVASIQQVSGTGGRTYPADSTVAATASRRLWNAVPPGKALSGIMVFPAGKPAKPFALELHGATGSRGLVVQF